MSKGAAASLAMTTLDDDAWDDLLSYIEERRVIPIVGPELLQVSTDRGPRLLLDWVAEKLFHELEHNHLLFIGSNFTSWLARLFLRMAKRQRLSDPRDVGEVLADDHSSEDDRLMSFLQQVSVRTRSYMGAEKFVAALYTRWLARRKPAANTASIGPARFTPPAREMPDNAVFLSYAREDPAAVQRIKSGRERVHRAQQGSL